MDVGTVLVTGGSSGLSAAVAAAVAGAGGTPVLLDRVPPALDADHELVDLADGRAALVANAGPRAGGVPGAGEFLAVSPTGGSGRAMMDYSPDPGS